MTALRALPRRPPQLVYAVDEWPPPFRLALLGLQYAVMAAIYLVLVVIILRHTHVTLAARVQAMGIACVGLAVGVVLQALPRGPVGSGFLAPPVFSAVYLAPSVLAAEVGGMPLVFGMTIFAGFVEVVIALALIRLRVVTTPVLSGLTVFVVGLQLGVVGIGQMLDVRHEGLAAFPPHLVVTILTLAVCVALSIWGRGALKLLCSMLGLFAGMLAASVIGIVGAARWRVLGDAAWIALPHATFLHVGFDLGLMPAFLAAGVAASLRAVGVVTTCQRINDADWRRPDTNNIRGGVLADGLSNVVGGVLGMPGMSIGPSLVGVSGATGATSRAIGFAAAAVLMVLAVSPKLSGLFLLVPQEVAGSLLVFTASFMIAGGMEIMLSRPIDTRAVYVIGISTLLALSENVFPTYFAHLPPAVRSVTASPLALGLGAAIVLTLIFRLGTHQSAEIAWSDAEGSVAAAMALLGEKAAAWKIDPTTAAHAVEHAGEVIAFILQHHARLPRGELHATFDGIEFRVDIFYPTTGAVPTPVHRLPLPPRPLAHSLDNEESSAVVGLANFLHGLLADRTRVRMRGGEVMVRLAYGL